MGNEDTPDLEYSDAASRNDLLMRVLTIIRSGSEVEDAVASQTTMENAMSGVVRKTGSMQQLSDGSGVQYTEFNTSRLASASGLLTSAAKAGKQKRGKKRKANTKFFQKHAEQKKNAKE